MKKKQYEITVNEDCVEIWGDLTIEEAFDWLNYFEKKGFDRVVIGDQNSTLRMMKSDYKEGCSYHEILYHEKVKECIKAYEKIAEMDSLVKKIMNDEIQERKNLGATICIDESIPKDKENEI